MYIQRKRRSNLVPSEEWAETVQDMREEGLSIAKISQALRERGISPYNRATIARYIQLGALEAAGTGGAGRRRKRSARGTNPKRKAWVEVITTMAKAGAPVTAISKELRRRELSPYSVGSIRKAISSGKLEGVSREQHAQAQREYRERLAEVNREKEQRDFSGIYLEIANLLDQGCSIKRVHAILEERGTQPNSVAFISAALHNGLVPGHQVNSSADEEWKDMVRSCAMEGMSLGEISQKLQSAGSRPDSPNTVRNRILAGDIEGLTFDLYRDKVNERKRVRQERWSERVRDLVREGMPISEITRLLAKEGLGGSSETSVRNFLRKIRSDDEEQAGG